MNKQQLDFLVGKAKELENHSDAYITSQLYAQFSGIASTRVIQIAVNKMRGKEIVMTDKDVKYILFGQVDFVRVENEMKQRAIDLGGRLQEFVDVLELSIPQKNRLYMEMAKRLGELLFTDEYLHESQ
jgi:hypothetical protein